MMFLEKSAEMTSAGSSVFSLAAYCKNLVAGTATVTTPVVTGSTLRLVAVLCDGPQETGGNCAMFTAPESILIEENVWNYFGFVYDALNKSGTFLVNDTFGYHDIAEGRSRESEYFTFDTKNWLMTDAIKGPSVRVASRKFQPFSDPPPASGYESFAGKISCLQLYEGALTPSQMFQQKSCPVTTTHPAKFAKCPFGYQYYQGTCYLLAVKEKDFSGAEYDCVTRSGKEKVLAANLGWHVCWSPLNIGGNFEKTLISHCLFLMLVSERPFITFQPKNMLVKESLSRVDANVEFLKVWDVGTHISAKFSVQDLL